MGPCLSAYLIVLNVSIFLALAAVPEISCIKSVAVCFTKREFHKLREFTVSSSRPRFPSCTGNPPPPPPPPRKRKTTPTPTGARLSLLKRGEAAPPGLLVNGLDFFVCLLQIQPAGAQHDPVTVCLHQRRILYCKRGLGSLASRPVTDRHE